MIHPLSSVAHGRFVELEDLLAFVRSDKCPEGVFEKESDDPYTNTLFVDNVMRAFFLAGGVRLPDDEIRLRFGKDARPYDLWHSKNVVWSNGGYRIAVDDVRGATYVTLWSAENKRVGELATRTHPVGGELAQYLGVSHVEIDRKCRKNGLGTQMYRALLRYMAPKYKGIASYLPDRANKTQVPRIYRRLGGAVSIQSEDYMIVNR